MHNLEQTSSPDTFSRTIQPEQVGQRLDLFLVSTLEGLSRTSVQQLITEGIARVNGQKSKASYQLRVGDEIWVAQSTPLSQKSRALPQVLPLEIVYEDNDLLVINKAAGMVVHPASGHHEDTLVNALLARYPDLYDGEGGTRPGIVHRLDKDTSGLMVVAKNLHTQAALVEQFKQHQVTKRYLALVEGNVSLEQGSIDAPIGRDAHHRQQMAITTVGSREARTHFRVLLRFSRRTLLLLQLETGRTHQIRVHLKAIGHPIVGDPVYGSNHTRSRPGLDRQFLHSYQLAFVHPTTGVTMEFEAPLPEDLEAVLRDETKL